jgi:hypothetical protein
MLMKIYFLVVFLLIFSACKKETQNTTPNPSTPASNQCITISGYTGLNETGDYIGPDDTSDWRLDDTWSSCERNLFGDTSFNSTCSFDDTLLSGPFAFPNPTSDVFHFAIGTSVVSTDTNLINQINHHDSTIIADILFLNQRAEIIGVIHTNKHQINFTSFSLNAMDSLSSDTIFRMYYRLTDTNSCVRMGHGDIRR